MKSFAQPRTEQPVPRGNSRPQGPAAETSVEAPGVTLAVHGPPTEVTVATTGYGWHGREYGSLGAAFLRLVPDSAFMCPTTEGAEGIRIGWARLSAACARLSAVWERASRVWTRKRIAAREYRAARSLRRWSEMPIPVPRTGSERQVAVQEYRQGTPSAAKRFPALRANSQCL